MKAKYIFWEFAVIGLLGCAGCAPAGTPVLSTPSSNPAAGGEIPYDLIEKFATEMAAWHFDSSEEIGGILADAEKLGIHFSAQDLNSILDEDERKRLWRVGAAEYYIGEFFGENAQAFFKVRHYVALAELWVGVVDAAGTVAECQGYIMIAAGNLGIAARVLREVPSRWDCWDVTACEPRPPMRPVTFSLEEEIIAEGERISSDMLDLSRRTPPDQAEFHSLMEEAADWDIRVRDALAGAA